MVAELVSGLAGLAGGLGNLFANSNAVQDNVLLQKDLMKYQAAINYKYSQKDLKTKWSANRQGLESAGYNPMLALAGVTSNSNWASPQSVSDANAGSSFASGFANALQARNLEQQGNLISSQVENYNADSELKRTQAITETYDQLQKQVHADLEDTERQLKQKDLSTYDERFLLSKKRTLMDIESMNVQNQVGLTNATSGMIQAQSGRLTAQANAYDIYSNKQQQLEQQKRYNEWARKHPWLSNIDQTLTRYLSPGASGAAGVYAGSKMPVKSGLKAPLGFK